ncbi:Dabb family protein [Clostridium algidicarnis]|uniref:Dabb family protein n=1 Tax=Clostridium algidicarnis TaxID=37659 RepID=A0ABS6C4D9_9CLOT|nr:Dabb family protein [Clostridium algidicarnis]MBB6631487.1 Dabb family protein [Clostridium algidicarnis]MBU3220348.1 Dabb family protein [Clostridium algidicarnis]MBU3228096.1 Dabb family protein [Clostridium algidicarnis]MBU3251735.1 Dabb family protein [Clostridium algidicarnis]MCB2286373.1 Dabb family protein [Clostridium algidicarnis]
MFTHIVLFKLKNATKENMEEANLILSSMEGKIEELKYLEVGVDIIRSERSYDIALITRFNSKEDMDKYQVSEYHVNHVLKNLRPLLESSVALDY